MLKKYVAFAAILILFTIVTIQAATYSDVVPVNWARFSAPAPSDSLALKIRKLLQNEVKFFLNSYVDSLPTNDSGLFQLTAYSDLEHMGIREPAEGTWVVNIALATGAYDSAIIGRSEADTRA